MTDAWDDFMQGRAEQAVGEEDEGVPEECEMCGHAIDLHVEGGCQGASELCGCQAWILEPCDDDFDETEEDCDLMDAGGFTNKRFRVAELSEHAPIIGHPQERGISSILQGAAEGQTVGICDRTLSPNLRPAAPTVAESLRDAASRLARILSAL